jgi:hypothetical protein
MSINVHVEADVDLTHDESHPSVLHLTVHKIDVSTEKVIAV